jgi:hypothetical protein
MFLSKTLNLPYFSSVSFVVLMATVLCMISLRVSATNLANTDRIENPQGFS